VALFVSVINVRTSRASLSLARKQEANRAPALTVHIYDALVYRVAGAAHRVVGVSLRVTNPRDGRNTVSEIDLETTYASVAGVLTTIRIPHNPGALTDLPMEVGPAFALTVPIDPHGAEPGWVFFRVEDKLLDWGKVEHHELVIKDSHEIRSSASIVLVRDLVDG